MGAAVSPEAVCSMSDHLLLAAGVEELQADADGHQHQREKHDEADDHRNRHLVDLHDGLEQLRGQHDAAATSSRS